MLILDYLKTHSLQELRDEHGIKYNVRGHLVTLAYDQFEASMNNPIACMCRGMVITDDAFVPSNVSESIAVDVPLPQARILAFPFVRFFNYGQGDLIFKPEKVYEKLDGSMIVMYYDDHKDCWQFGTRNVPDGSNTANGGQTSFRELVLKAAAKHYGYEDPSMASSHGLFWNRFSLVKGMTYIFELMTPENKVVVEHRDYHLYLIGARSGKNDGFQELDVDQVAASTGFDCAPSFKMKFKDNSKDVLDTLVKFANMRDPLYHEGFVVLGENWQRLKIKSDAYVTYNKVHDLSQYDILNLILTGEIDDFMAMMPEYQRNLATDLSEKVAHWARSLTHELRLLDRSKGGLASRKDFAAYVNQNQALSRVAKTIFRAYTENHAILDAQDVIKPWLDSNTNRYQDGFLRNMMGWL